MRPGKDMAKVKEKYVQPSDEEVGGSFFSRHTAHPPDMMQLSQPLWNHERLRKVTHVRHGDVSIERRRHTNIPCRFLVWYCGTDSVEATHEELFRMRNHRPQIGPTLIRHSAL